LLVKTRIGKPYKLRFVLFVFSDVCKYRVLDLLLLCLCSVERLITDSAVSVSSVSSSYVLLDFYFVRVLIFVLRVYIAHLKHNYLFVGHTGTTCPASNERLTKVI
jgi:hypothetical protein